MLLFPQCCDKSTEKPVIYHVISMAQSLMRDWIALHGQQSTLKIFATCLKAHSNMKPSHSLPYFQLLIKEHFWQILEMSDGCELPRFFKSLPCLANREATFQALSQSPLGKSSVLKLCLNHHGCTHTELRKRLISFLHLHPRTAVTMSILH